jgi:serine/threonine protein kinase
MNEVRALDKVCNMSHRNVVEIFRHGWITSSHYFFDMELCDMTLEQYIREDLYVMEKYNPSNVADIITQIASGVAYIHGLKEIHRDLKPSNGCSL